MELTKDGKRSKRIKAKIYNKSKSKGVDNAVVLKMESGGLSSVLADKRIIYTAAFVLPFLCMLAIYALFKVFPFGDNTVLVMDMDCQYAEFFSYLHRVLIGEDSLTYSFTKEMGGNVLGLLAYYASSPFFLLALFFPHEAMPEGIALVTMLKIGASGLTFAIYLKNVFKKCDLSVVIFSCAYALMGYSMHYAMCVMWLDAVVWLPIILLGVERVLDGKSGWLFLITYTITMISNYYTGYMSTIFIVIYFIYRYFVRDDKKSVRDFFIKAGKMLGFGAMGILLSGFILLPAFLDMFGGKLSGKTSLWMAEGFWSMNIFEIPRRLFIGQYDSITNTGSPSIFCGMLCGIMTGVYFLNPKIKLKAKVAAILVYVVMLVSFFIKRIDMAWHIFSYPNWFPYRYAYVFCFFSVTLAFCGFSKMREASKIWFFAGVGIYLALLAAVYFFDDSVLKNEELVALSFILVGVYIIALIFLFFGAEKLKPFICCALILLTCGELVVNGYTDMVGLSKEHKYELRSEYARYDNRIGEAVDFVHERDDGFYRMEKTFSRTDNDNMSFGLNGMTHYSSTFNSNVLSFNSRMGMLQVYVRIRYLGSTLLTDSLLGVKYVLADKKVNDEYVALKETEDYKVYENPYALQIGFSADESALGVPDYGSSGMENQDKFAESILGESFVDRVQNVSSANSGAGREFRAPEDGLYYIDFGRMYNGKIELTVNGRSVSYDYDTTPSYDNQYKKIYCLGSYDRNDRIRVTGKDPDSMSSVKIYRVDNDRFEEACLEKRDNGSLNITDYGSTWLEGEIALEDDQVLFTTIPYEKGWKAYIDGERVDTECAQETFLAVRAEAGEHTVKLKYSAPGLAPALTVSILTLAGILIYVFRLRIFSIIKIAVKFVKKQTKGI